jgi:hypothetical protein
MRYPLGNDVNGNPIDVPPDAKAWRVRQGGGRRGRPKVIFDDATGRQLEVPLETTFEEFCEYELAPGQYRLEAVDGNGQLIPNIVAVTMIPDEPEEAPAAPTLAMDERAQYLRTIQQQHETMCRALQVMASAFGTVKPQFDEPVIRNAAEPPVTPSPTSQIQQIQELMNAFPGMVSQILQQAAMAKGFMKKDEPPKTA